MMMIPLFYPLQSFNDLIPINFVRLERKRFRKRGVSLLANAKLKKILLSYIHGDIIKLWRSSYARFQDNNTWPKKKERP